MKTIQELTDTSIIWHPNPPNPCYFQYMESTCFYYLRMNNFPDESLFTVIAGDEIADLEDLPENWVLNE